MTKPLFDMSYEEFKVMMTKLREQKKEKFFLYPEHPINQHQNPLNNGLNKYPMTSEDRINKYPLTPEQAFKAPDNDKT